MMYGNLGILYEGLEEYEKAEEFAINAVQLAEQVGHPQLEAYRKVLERIRQERNGTA
ncbi:MAG: hypothetical protein GY801_50090 [bacterium]|nr:hypothetical protein [bacterium]